MPAQVQYVTPVAPMSATFVAFPNLALIFGASLECNAVSYDQQYFLGVLDRSYPADYIAGLQQTINSGYELLQAAARVGERVSLAIARWVCCSFVMSAHGGAKATGVLEIWKTDPTALTIMPGSSFTTNNGQVFLTTAPASFDVMNLGPLAVPIEAIAFGYEYNVPGEVVTRRGEILQGDIVNIGALVVQPDILDTTIQFRQVLPTQGGRSACLDGLAADLNFLRLFGESDPEFVLRIKEAPDTVSPNAIIRGVNRLLQARNPAWSCVLREIGYPLFPGMFFDAGSSADSPQNPDHNFAWDMNPNLRPSDRYKLLVSTIDMRAFFLVEVPAVRDVRDFGLVYDVPIVAAYPLASAYDTTASNAKDAPYDGASLFSGAFYKAIYNVIERKRAGGVGFALVQTFVPAPPPPSPPA